MKSQQFRTELKHDGRTTYRLFIPVEYQQGTDKSIHDELEVSVTDNQNIEQKLTFESGQYILERNDPAGRYYFRIVLKKGNELIEEQQVVVIIQKAIDTDTTVDLSDLLKISDKEFEKTVLQIIDKMTLSVGHQQGFMTLNTSPVVVDKDSESVYRELKKFQRDNEVISILCKVINNETGNGPMIWKTLKVFCFYRAVEGVYFLNPLGQRRYTDNNLTRFLHETCIKYLDAVNTIKNRELVMKSLLYFSLECITPQARILGIRSLAATGKRNELVITDALFKVINEDSDINTRLEAIRGLEKYDLSSYQSNILEIMQDASPQIRKEIYTTLQKIAFLPDFDFSTDLFENETDDASRAALGRLIYNRHSEKARDYFLRILDYQDEKLTTVILEILFYTSDNYAIEKFQKIKETAILSAKLQKRLEEYLKKKVK
ncbi:MAG: HEAT repeat domain-containing protein [Bacteroidales bacterium]|nr:HEAT repeat domain-containing protein [Bacteroidales bacterium]